MNIRANNHGRPAREPAGQSGSRSEQLRRRRTQPPAVAETSAPRSAARPAARPLRPVTVRNATFGTPVRSRVATTNPRRQFYLALDTPGTELRLPALPTFRPGPRLASGFIALVCLVGIFSMLFSSFFVLGAPVVKGLERLTQAEIEAALDITNLKSVEVDAAALRDALLERFDILESVGIAVGLPNSLTVTVKERQPSFAWQTEQETRWADRNGYLFTPAGEPVQMLTITSADQPPLYISPEQIAAIQAAEEKLAAAKEEDQGVEAATLALEKAKNPTGSRRIDQGLMAAAQKLSGLLPEGTSLAYSSVHGLGWLDAGGWDVYIGHDLANFDQKFALYQSIIQQLNGQGITPVIVSVEFLTAPYYRLER
jgi:hypothetical protein